MVVFSVWISLTRSNFSALKFVLWNELGPSAKNLVEVCFLFIASRLL